MRRHWRDAELAQVYAAMGRQVVLTPEMVGRCATVVDGMARGLDYLLALPTAEQRVVLHPVLAEVGALQGNLRRLAIMLDRKVAEVRAR